MKYKIEVKYYNRKYNYERKIQKTLKDRQGTDAPERHPSVIVQLSNTSSPRPVSKKKKEKRGEYKNILNKQPTCRLLIVSKLREPPIIL